LKASPSAVQSLRVPVSKSRLRGLPSAPTGSTPTSFSAGAGCWVGASSATVRISEFMEGSRRLGKDSAVIPGECGAGKGWHGRCLSPFREVTAMACLPGFPASARLRHVCDCGPGIVRERVRGQFFYRNADGRLIRDRLTLNRIRALVIPPAWEDVWICPAANGHLQAT